MVAALECYFDGEASRRIRALWDALAAAGVPSLRDLTHGKHRPHLSVAVADELDAAAVTSALAGMPAAPPLRLDFQYAGQFVGRVLWLGPAYELGRSVRELREERGWSQTELARAAGMTQSAVARFEAGGTVPTLVVLERLARALGVELAVKFNPKAAAA